MDSSGSRWGKEGECFVFLSDTSVFSNCLHIKHLYCYIARIILFIMGCDGINLFIQELLFEGFIYLLFVASLIVPLMLLC